MDYRALLAILVSQRERALELIVKHDIGIAELQETLDRGLSSRDGLARLLESIDRDIEKVEAKLSPVDKETAS